MGAVLHGWVFLLCVLLLLPVVSPQAPGDEDVFCTSSSVAVMRPAYLSNFIILMDSFSYINLLPSPTSPAGGVWQEVDADGETLGGTSTSVSLMSSVQVQQYMCVAELTCDRLPHIIGNRGHFGNVVTLLSVFPLLGGW